MVSTSPILRKSSDELWFVELSTAAAYCRDILGLDLAMPDLQALVSLRLLPVFSSGLESGVLLDDLMSLRSVLLHSDFHLPTIAGDGVFWRDIPLVLKLSPITEIDLIGRLSDIEPTFFSAVRNLSSASTSAEDLRGEVIDQRALSYFPPTLLKTSSRKILGLAERQLARVEHVNSVDTSHFANSAYYMGSKRGLRGYLVEGISSVLPDSGVVIDLMCGSGAASSAFSRLWRTYASDLQTFCQNLAVVQGGGFSVAAAQELLDKVLPFARQNAAALQNLLSEPLAAEDELFHSDVNQDLLEEYQSFVARFPTYPAGGNWNDWCPVSEVEKRKEDPRHFPYCLFSCYFANTYFGLRQSVEIDSLRAGIEQLDGELTRRWALGALVAAMSALGTTYGGHFAQPKFKEPGNYTLDNLSSVLELRSYSIMHEFTVRLIKLSEASEKSAHPINIVNGPWKKALTSLDEILKDSGIPVLVYLDAPYKRDEYSRYYHVLETVVRYSYPSSTGIGRVPEKGTDDRPASEFFTRVNTRMNSSFVEVIGAILDRGWTCAWSYSDNGDAQIVQVIAELRSRSNFTARSYAAPYEHKSQGGVKKKLVTEYLILLTPK